MSAFTTVVSRSKGYCPGFCTSPEMKKNSPLGIYPDFTSWRFVNNLTH
jgi:hypothetical protein